MQNIRVLIIIVCCVSDLTSQTLNYSRPFPVISKNLPLTLLNNHKSYFYVLRYNKLAHDLTLERRSKPECEIISFTPLKLDSVNSDWFNYSHLEHQLLEYNHKIYFIFKKELNNSKSLYFKYVDSLGKSSGFFEIINLERESNWTDFDLEFKVLKDGKLLIVSTRKFFNQSVKKTAILFGMEEKKTLWTRNLPLENPLTGYSHSFTCDAKQCLYYIMIKAQTIGFKRKYIKHAQWEVPLMRYDSLNLMCIVGNNTAPKSIALLQNINRINALFMITDEDRIYLNIQYTKSEQDSSSVGLFLFSFCSAKDQDKPVYQLSFPVDSSICERLTYYDGTDLNYCWDKEFDGLAHWYKDNWSYQISERREEDEYKELFVWNTNLSNGQIIRQDLIPRRLLSSEAWSRYSNIGEAGTALNGENLLVFMAEATSNFHLDPSYVKYTNLRKRSSLRYCNLVLFEIGPLGLNKKLLHQNGNFDFVPIHYLSTDQSDLIFYFSSGKQERFAIFPLSPI